MPGLTAHLALKVPGGWGGSIRRSVDQPIIEGVLNAPHLTHRTVSDLNALKAAGGWVDRSVDQSIIEGVLSAPHLTVHILSTPHTPPLSVATPPSGGRARRTSSRARGGGGSKWRRTWRRTHQRIARTVL